MATVPPKKKVHFAGSILDIVSWGVREAALPIPDFMYAKKKKVVKVVKGKK